MILFFCRIMASGFRDVAPSLDLRDAQTVTPAKYWM